MTANAFKESKAHDLSALLSAVATEPQITTAMRLAKDLEQAAARTTHPERDAKLLSELFRHGDGLSAIAALHAISHVQDPLADRLLLEVAGEGEPAFSEHAAWAFEARRPSSEAVRALRTLVHAGGFTAMVAERTLDGWFLATATTLPRIDLRRPVQRGGIVVIQPFLHARLDPQGSNLGSGDSGGIASLLRSLGSALPNLDDVDEVITVTRRFEAEPRSELLAAGHRVERITIGPPGPLPWREGWLYRAQIEQQFVALGEALAGRRVVWHLRMADVGSLAAADAAQKLGHQVVFTAVPDPHIVINALQDSGRLDRSNFALEDAAAQYWFRSRLVERLAQEADHLVVLPRPTIRHEIHELVGVSVADLDRRSSIIAEGVDVAESDRARHRASGHGRSALAQQIIDSLPSERRSLPWVLTVGRLSPSKGPQRIVEAVVSDPALADRVNVVIIGGDLENPSPDEQSTIERIQLAAADAEPGLVTLTGHLPPSVVSDLMAETVCHGGVYVCASDKEEFGLAIVEALAAGAAVVAPERGGPRTYISHSDIGILCDTLSISSLRAAIVAALELEGIPGRAQRARDKVRTELSIEKMAQRLGGVYRALVPPVHTDERFSARPLPSRVGLPLR